MHSGVRHTHHTSTAVVKREAEMGSTRTEDDLKAERLDSAETDHVTRLPPEPIKAETDPGERIKAEQDADFKCEEGGSEPMKCEPNEMAISDATEPLVCGKEISPRDKEISPRDKEISPRDEEISPRDKEISPRDEGTPRCDDFSQRSKAHETDNQMASVEKSESAGVINSDENLFKCTKCGRSFDQIAQLVKHQVIHLNDRPHVCGHCGMGFRWPSHLARHQRVHAVHAPYICAQCGRGYIWEFNLKHHQKIHFGDPYVCSHCGKHFSRVDHLNKHLTTHPGSVAELKQKREKIPSRKKSHTCALCGRAFSWKYRLKQHQKVHMREHTCTQCGKCFATKSNLVLHKSSHSDERPYSCECGKHFKRAQELKRHQTLCCADKTLISDH